MSESDFTKDPGALVATIARIFAAEGRAREVGILANAEINIAQTGYDNLDGGTYFHSLYLRVAPSIFVQLDNDRQVIEKAVRDKAILITRPYSNDHIEQVLILPVIAADDGWQDKAKAWVNGKGVTNQGRVRSDNIAAKTCDGLLFRSEPEIHLYRALKAAGVSFAPLAVFIRGGQEYRRIEPDFVLLKDGIVLVVEVDGDTVHQETPAEAHARTTMLVHEGAHLERVKASECSSPELAQVCAKRLLSIVAKLKENR